jgi:hypothetical protein
MASTKLFKGISVITAGPALGHGMTIDADTLEQVVQAGNDLGQIKVLSDHSSSVSNIIGYLENFSLDGGRVRADLTLFESHDGFAYFSELLTRLPGQIGFSISFSGVPRVAQDGTQLANVSTLYSVDLVTTPAANPTGVYSARVDTHKSLNMDTTVKESAPVIEAAPEALAAPVTKLAEPTLADVVAMLTSDRAQLAEILTLLKADASSDVVEVAPAMSAKLSAETPAVVAEPAAAEPAVTEPAKEIAPEVTAEVSAELSENPKIVALNNELARLKIDLEASKGTKPLEIVAPTLSRAELLKQFNEEKNPGRAAVIYQKLNTLAR